MNNIIQQVCIEFIENIIKFVSDGEVKTLYELEEGFKKISDNFLKGIMKVYLEGIDECVAKDKAGRRRRGLVVERRNEERTIYTQFGEMTYSRTYYWDKREEEYVHPVDKVAGVESYERVSLSVAAELVNHSAEASYGESSRHVTESRISRQTVMNKVRKIHDLKLDEPGGKRLVKILHVAADEDHVKLQDGSDTSVPLITVYEGVRRVSKNRYECVNPRHFSAYGSDVEELWLEVSQYIYEHYDEEVLERIYIHGDGATWIKAGKEYLPKAAHVLDQYHQNKALMEATGSQPEYRDSLRETLKGADREGFCKLVREMMKRARTEKEKERINKFRKYMLKNWEGIEIKKYERCGGSCAEGQVSHVLSSRLSSRPMGWSKEGLSFMSKLRVYCVNGGRVGPQHLRKDEELEQYIKKAIKRTKNAFLGFNPDEIGNIFVLKMGKVTPVYRILRCIQHAELI